MSSKLELWTVLLVTVTVLALVAQPAAARNRKIRGKAQARQAAAKASAAPAEQEQPAESAAQEASGPVKVAVLDLGMLGLSSAMRKNLEMLLRNSIDTIDGFKVIAPVDVQMALQDPKNRDVARCGGGPRCAVKVGRLVGADRVVFGTIGSIGDAFSLDLRVMRVGDGKQIAREHSRVSGSRDLLIPELRLAVYRMVAPDKIRGSLLVDIDVAGVEVEIDGNRVGVTPLDHPVEDLAPGNHVVVLKRPGFSEFQQAFTIRPFETARLQLQLEVGAAPSAAGAQAQPGE